jgi:hypothetical protein
MRILAWWGKGRLPARSCAGVKTCRSSQMSFPAGCCGIR